MTDTRFAKSLIFVNSLVPLGMLGLDAYQRKLGANPLEYVTRTTGMLTLVFLLLTLSVTPIRKITGFNMLGKMRRLVGIFAFFYAALHLLTYIWFDRGFKLRGTAADIAQRPFIAIGMAAFLILIPLAITSTNKMIRRLGGKRWAMLHRLVYGAVILGVVHFWMLVKSDTRLPIGFALVVAALLSFRIVLSNRSETKPAGLVSPP